MTPEILRYKIPSARDAAFHAAYASAGEILKRAPECCGFELLRSAKDPELYLLTIDWISPEAHRHGFRTSALFAEFLAFVKPFIPDLLEMEHYVRTPIAWSRA